MIQIKMFGPDVKADLDYNTNGWLRDQAHKIEVLSIKHTSTCSSTGIKHTILITYKLKT